MTSAEFDYTKKEKRLDTKKSTKTAILATKIIVSGTLLLYLISKLDFTSISKLQSDVATYLALSVFMIFSALWFMTLRWKIVLLLIDFKHYSLTSLYRFYLIGSFFNIFIPGAIGGDAMRVYYISKVYKLTKKRALLSVFIERLAGLFALAVILMFSLVYNDSIREKLHFDNLSIALFSLGIVIVLVLAKLLTEKKISISYSNMAMILLLSGLGQFGDIFISYIYSTYLDLNISILNLMSIMPLVYIATVVPVSLGGVGVREGVMTAGMALYGVGVSDAVLVSFLLYFTKIVVALAGWFVYIRTGKSNTRKE